VIDLLPLTRQRSCVWGIALDLPTMSSGDRPPGETSKTTIAGPKRGRSPQSGQAKTKSPSAGPGERPGPSTRARAAEQHPPETSSKEATPRRVKRQDTRASPASHVSAGKKQPSPPAQRYSPAAGSRSQSQSSDGPIADEEQVNQMKTTTEQLFALLLQLQRGARGQPGPSAEGGGGASNPNARQQPAHFKFPTYIVDELERALNLVSSMLGTKGESSEKMFSERQLDSIIEEIFQNVGDPSERAELLAGILKTLQRYPDDAGQGDDLLYAKIKNLKLMIRGSWAEADKGEGGTGDPRDDFIESTLDNEPDSEKRLATFLAQLELFKGIHGMHPREESIAQLITRLSQAIRREEKLLKRKEDALRPQDSGTRAASRGKNGPSARAQSEPRQAADAGGVCDRGAKSAPAAVDCSVIGLRNPGSAVSARLQTRGGPARSGPAGNGSARGGSAVSSGGSVSIGGARDSDGSHRGGAQGAVSQGGGSHGVGAQGGGAPGAGSQRGGAQGAGSQREGPQQSGPQAAGSQRSGSQQDRPQRDRSQQSASQRRGP
jgi:hypothetical protein